MASVNSPFSSILKSSPLNIPRRRNTNVSTPKEVRFRAQASEIDVAGILKDYLDGKNESRYKQLLELRNDPNVHDSFLLVVLRQVNKSIGLLVPKLEHFVDALLNLSWMSRSPEVIEEYLGFVQTLVIAHTYYCQPTVKMLISTFETVENPHHSHEILKGILQLIPLSRKMILEALNECLPYHGVDTEFQVNYVKNLLKFTEYCPGSRPSVLNIIIARLVKLDSLVPREELLKQAVSVQHQEGPTASKTLDSLMGLMFEFCRTHCSGTWDAHRAFYYEMLSTFETYILSAIGIHHTHFLMMYICSTKQALYEAFIERLWNLFQSPSTSLTLRKSAADFLASFLGKSNFIPMNVVIFCLERVCLWIHSYLDRQSKGEGAAAFKIRSHSAFYAACHIPFYVIAARHEDLYTDRKLLGSLQKLDLNRIVTCALNPLRYCHGVTVRQFAESASHLQVVFCHTIIKRNQRLCLPENAENLVIDTEYPFEKYLLATSASYTAPLIINRNIGIEDSLYDSDQVMEELLSESPRVAFIHHFLG